jgi:hypothetical protein
LAVEPVAFAPAAAAFAEPAFALAAAGLAFAPVDPDLVVPAAFAFAVAADFAFAVPAAFGFAAGVGFAVPVAFAFTGVPAFALPEAFAFAAAVGFGFAAPVVLALAAAGLEVAADAFRAARGAGASPAPSPRRVLRRPGRVDGRLPSTPSVGGWSWDSSASAIVPSWWRMDRSPARRAPVAPPRTADGARAMAHTRPSRGPIRGSGCIFPASRV